MTSSIVWPDIELSVKIVPALPAARAPATSPSGSIIRVKPIGLIRIGIATSKPRTEVASSGPGTPLVTPTRGRNWTASIELRFARSVDSAPAPPSM